MSTPRSLVFITVDCLRADHVGFNGYQRPTTPFLDRLAQESIVVRNAIVAGSPTYYSFPSIMASRYPLAFGRDVVGLAPGETSLATVLNESGYATAAFIAANPYLSSRFGYDAGFEIFQDFLGNESGVTGDLYEGEANSPKTPLSHKLAQYSHKAGPIGPLYDELYFRYCQSVARRNPQSLDQLRRFPAADVVVDRASEWLSGCDERSFFLWLHLMDPHSPYYPPEKALNAMDNGKVDADQARYLNSYWNRGGLKEKRLRSRRDDVVALYDAGIRWVDTQVERLVDTLRGLNLWDNCVFALTGDHGEEFLEHGGRYHSPSKLVKELVRVPLMLRVPGMSATRSADSPFSLLHLAPTLLDTVGNAIPASFRGRSLWPQMQKGQSWDQVAISECVANCNNPYHSEDRMGARILAVCDAQHKLVVDFRTGQAELFDLKADPDQMSPLPQNVEKPIRRRLLEMARKHISSSSQSRDYNLRLDACLKNLRLEWAPTATPAGLG